MYPRTMEKWIGEENKKKDQQISENYYLKEQKSIENFRECYLILVGNKKM